MKPESPPPPGIIVAGQGMFADRAIATTKTHVDKLPVPKGSYVLTVTVEKLESAPVSCKVKMNLTNVKREILAMMDSSAKVEGTGLAAESDCLEAVIADLVATKVTAAVAEHDK